MDRLTRKELKTDKFVVEFGRTVEFAIRSKAVTATFHVLTPYPGTRTFERLEAEGRLLHRDWDRYDTDHAVFRPCRMTPEQLEAGHKQAIGAIAQAYIDRLILDMGHVTPP